MSALFFPDTENQIKCLIKEQIKRAKPSLYNKQLAEILNEDLGIFPFTLSMGIGIMTMYSSIISSSMVGFTHFLVHVISC